VSAIGSAVLELRGVSRRFGGVQALDSIDLTGLAGEVHGLVGPNGAGKSTLIGCVTGVIGIDAGTITCAARRIDTEPAHARARLGIARTFQKIRLAEELTVFENVAAGLAAQLFGSGIKSYGALLKRIWSGVIAARVDEALDTAGIAALRDQRVGSLPYGQRHFVELARCLVAAPRVLLLDEPATGLADAERQRLLALIRGAADRGCLVLLVEHDLKLVGRLCDRVTVLDYGQWIFTGTPAEAQRDAGVVKAYLGSARFAHGA
jgi:branched-chain amino acid transport system ATP-binding protein